MDFLLEKKIGTFSTTGSFESESVVQATSI